MDGCPVKKSEFIAIRAKGPQPLVVVLVSGVPVLVRVLNAWEPKVDLYGGRTRRGLYTVQRVDNGRTLNKSRTIAHMRVPTQEDLDNA